MRTPDTPFASKLIRRLGLGLLCALAGTSAVHAQTTWYLKEKMATDAVSWRTPHVWNSAPDGSGENATAINAADTYNTNGLYVRANGKFQGGKLVQQGGRIDMKRASQTITGDWEVAGGEAVLHQGVRNNASYLFTVNGSLILTSPLRVLHTTDGMRGIDLTIGTLTGASPLIIGSGNPARNTFVSLGVMKFENYTGRVVVSEGSTLAFANDQKWTAPLEVAPGAVLLLTKTITVPAATLGGQPVAEGTHTAEQLRQAHGELISADSSGSLIVSP